MTVSQAADILNPYLQLLLQVHRLKPFISNTYIFFSFPKLNFQVSKVSLIKETLKSYISGVY